MERDKELVYLCIRLMLILVILFLACRSAFLLSMLCCGQGKVPLDALVEPAKNLLSNSETQLV